MRNVFVVSDNIFSPIGHTTRDNVLSLANDIPGVKEHEASFISSQSFYGSLFEDKHIRKSEKYTRFEQLLIASMTDALDSSSVSPADKRTIFILSTTKGNIGLLETEDHSPLLNDRIALHHSAKLLAAHFNFAHTPVIISNACISGVLAIITGMRLIQSGLYDHAVIAGADLVSKFVLSGFQSFQAISNGPCKPFDAARNGINLGEGAATVVLSADKSKSSGINIAGGSVSNDANHISGPSRTGEELCIAIKKAMKEAGVSEAATDLVSAHGTATIYNDEMEAKALTLAGLQSVPVNSLKGFYGHTLGAAGLIESIITMHSLKEGVLFPTRGFSSMGVSVPLNVSNQLQRGHFKTALKTASGFGGCNAALFMRMQ